MDVQSKLQKLKKRLGLTAALSIAAMSASLRRTAGFSYSTPLSPQPKKQKSIPLPKMTYPDNPQVKQYCNFIEIGSLRN